MWVVRTGLWREGGAEVSLWTLIYTLLLVLVACVARWLYLIARTVDGLRHSVCSLLWAIAQARRDTDHLTVTIRGLC